MNIIRKKNGPAEVFEVHGRLDGVGSQKAQEAIVPAIPANGKMVIDLSGCDYVASSGLRVLLIAAKQSALAGCNLAVCGTQPAVWDIIVMTGFENVLKAYPTLDDALAAFDGEEA